VTASFTLFLVAIFIGAVWWGWEWPYIAKLMPVYIAAVPGLLLGVTQLIGEASGSEARRAKKAEGVEMDDTTKVELDEKTELRRTLVYFAWFIGGAAGIWLLGIVITLPLLAFLYMLVEGREKLVSSVIMATCTYGMIWGLFEYTLEMRWPPGLLFGY
jgi:Tripartite tricarboxylate transporter TctB family